MYFIDIEIHPCYEVDFIRLLSTMASTSNSSLLFYKSPDTNFEIEIKQDDVNRLQPEIYLNECIINFYMQ